MKNRLKPFVLAVMLAALTSASVQAKTYELSAAETRNLAAQAYGAGQLKVTLQLADALLQRDSQDRLALVLRSRALRGLGRTDEAIAPARAAWALSRKDSDYYVAAMTMAQALASDGKRIRAQFWLRRAADLAPSAAAKTAAINGYSYVKSRNPVSLTFSASLSPSSNINNGSTATKLGSFTLTGASLALSGVEASLAMTARYMLPPNETAQTELVFSASSQNYALSDKAKSLAPTAKGSDYAFAALEVGVAHRRKMGKAGLNFGVTLGHNWYGGQALSNYLRFELGSQWLLNAQTQASLLLQAEGQERLDGPNRDATILGATAAVTRVFANRDSLRFSTNLRDTQSRASWIDHKSVSLRLDYARAAPVKGVSLSGGINFEARDYAVSAYTADGRQDQKLGLSVTAVFNTFDYLGFVPSLELNAARNRSNISLYKRREIGLAFGVKSAF